MSRPVKHSPEEVSTIVELYKSGKGCVLLARLYGCTPTTIAAVLRRAGENVRGRGQAKTPETCDSPTC
jgi:transposase-like protein